MPAGGRAIRQREGESPSCGAATRQVLGTGRKDDDSGFHFEGCPSHRGASATWFGARHNPPPFHICVRGGQLPDARLVGRGVVGWSGSYWFLGSLFN